MQVPLKRFGRAAFYSLKMVEPALPEQMQNIVLGILYLHYQTNTLNFCDDLLTFHFDLSTCEVMRHAGAADTPQARASVRASAGGRLAEE